MHGIFKIIVILLLIDQVTIPNQVLSQDNEWNDLSVSDTGTEPRHATFMY